MIINIHFNSMKTMDESMTEIMAESMIKTTNKTTNKYTNKYTTDIYTDGSCLKNPNGPSGWAFILKQSKSTIICSGGEEKSTNNRMELTAVIEALNWCQTRKCNIYSDSQLTIKCATNEWKRKANLDLWDQYNIISRHFEINWVWVKAHSGIDLNEQVDKLARAEATRLLSK
jgi:ribonuclease HI